MIQMLGRLLSQGEGVTIEGIPNRGVDDLVDVGVIPFAICRPTRGRLIRSRLVWSLFLCVVLFWITTPPLQRA
jgi:hypothetical protein